ncbi:hypothetical protein, partial [Klebsiella pneumoniae]|uniref:hypothetical protein n=1 Tax=Klebsiella pneumoniae TaxID=573 RepID=UPI001C6F9CCD
QRLGCQKACVLPENPASYRVVRTKSYLFNKAVKGLNISNRLLTDVRENMFVKRFKNVGCVTY